MKKRSGRIITLLAALCTAAAMSVSVFAGAPDTKSDLILQAAQTQERNSGKDYIKIISPSDGEVFYQGRDITYRVNVSGSYSDYMTRPYITLVLENKADPTKNKHIKDFTYPKDLSYKERGERGNFNGTIETDRLSPGIYYFGVVNWPSLNGRRLTEKEAADKKLNPPLLAVEIEVRAHGAHSWDDGKITKPATCTEAGEMTYTCKLCKQTKTEEIPATGHTWDEGVVTVKPDVQEPGIKTYTCKICKTTKTEEIPALKATIKTSPASVKTKVKKNSVTVSWKKIKNTKKNKKLLRQIKSVEIQYSTDRKFSRENRISKKTGKNKTKVVLKLKGKTTYYIRVRYVGNDGASKWSNVKRVKTSTPNN